MAMMMMMMMMTVCPAHKKPSFILFSTFILCCILVPSVSFVVFFLSSFGSETNIMYELSTGSGWRKNDSKSFLFCFFIFKIFLNYFFFFFCFWCGFEIKFG